MPDSHPQHPSSPSDWTDAFAALPLDAPRGQRVARHRQRVSTPGAACAGHCGWPRRPRSRWSPSCHCSVWPTTAIARPATARSSMPDRAPRRRRPSRAQPAPTPASRRRPTGARDAANGPNRARIRTPVRRVRAARSPACTGARRSRRQRSRSGAVGRARRRIGQASTPRCRSLRLPRSQRLALWEQRVDAMREVAASKARSAGWSPTATATTARWSASTDAPPIDQPIHDAD